MSHRRDCLLAARRAPRRPAPIIPTNALTYKRMRSWLYVTIIQSVCLMPILLPILAYIQERRFSFKM